ncbi:hypothetical protein COLO4_38166 [Corchorus olitorius]|uniref:Uncharacterized protein n=1 Tax=Corchorus olitorius TaxID=93759 RepID=A0A1R3FWL3_9ROSI|nr:hypothetical protein COLO4_38166 [Corchorus olitorius]
MAKPQAFRSENLTVEWCRISGKRRNNGTGKGKKNEEKPRKKVSIQGISKTGPSWLDLCVWLLRCALADDVCPIIPTLLFNWKCLGEPFCHFSIHVAFSCTLIGSMLV